MNSLFFFFNQIGTAETIKSLINKNDVLLLIGIIIFCGLFGGFANFYRFIRNEVDRSYFLKRSLITGLVASACVPLFLNMVSSSLLKLDNGIRDLFVFTGFCMLASYFSFSFLKSLSDRTIGDLDRKTAELEKKTFELEEASNKNDQLLEATLKQVEKSKAGKEAVEVPQNILKNLNSNRPIPKQDVATLLNLLPTKENIFSNERLSDLFNLDHNKGADILQKLEASKALSKFELGSSTFYTINSDNAASQT